MSGGLLAVIPILADIDGTTTHCLNSIWAPDSAAGLDPSEILLVDNTRHGWRDLSEKWEGARVYRDPAGHNLGVARSWNIGAREVLERGLDYLVIMSSVMRFGPQLHCTLRSQLDSFWGHDVIEVDGHSWHCIAIHRRRFEMVGLFCSGYWPAYYESIDWCRRLHLIGREHGWPHVWVNAMSQGAALHTDLVTIPNEHLLALYRERWGGDKGGETFVLPYGNKPMDYDVEEPIPVLAERYGLAERGKGWW